MKYTTTQPVEGDRVTCGTGRFEALGSVTHTLPAADGTTLVGIRWDTGHHGYRDLADFEAHPMLGYAWVVA